MTTISLKLPSHLLKILEKESKTRRTTKSSLVRECLERSFMPSPQDHETTCYELAQDLVGSIKKLPRDLAINPIYLDRFGR